MLNNLNVIIKKSYNFLHGNIVFNILDEYLYFNLHQHQLFSVLRQLFVWFPVGGAIIPMTVHAQHRGGVDRQVCGDNLKLEVEADSRGSDQYLDWATASELFRINVIYF